MVSSVTNDRCHEYRGMSNDVKPTENVGNGSIFFEMDTQKVFMFNEDSKTWIEI